MTPKNLQNLDNLIKIGSPLCVPTASGDMVRTCVSNSDPWGCSGVRVMNIFVFYVGPHFPNIEYFEVLKVYGGI